MRNSACFIKAELESDVVEAINYSQYILERDILQYSMRLASFIFVKTCFKMLEFATYKNCVHNSVQHDDMFSLRFISATL